MNEQIEMPQGEPLPGGAPDHESHLLGLQTQTAGYDRDRAIAEAEKARHELAQATRPWWKKPTTWISILSLVLGGGSAGLQYVFSRVEYQLAKIEKAQAEFEVIKIEDRYAVIEAAIEKKRAELKTIEARIDGALEDGIKAIESAKVGLVMPTMPIKPGGGMHHVLLDPGTGVVIKTTSEDVVAEALVKLRDTREQVREQVQEQDQEWDREQRMLGTAKTKFEQWAPPQIQRQMQEERR